MRVLLAHHLARTPRELPLPAVLFRWNIFPDSAANNTKRFGNACRAAVSMADREQVPPPW